MNMSLVPRRTIGLLALLMVVTAAQPAKAEIDCIATSVTFQQTTGGWNVNAYAMVVDNTTGGEWSYTVKRFRPGGNPPYVELATQTLGPQWDDPCDITCYGNCRRFSVNGMCAEWLGGCACWTPKPITVINAALISGDVVSLEVSTPATEESTANNYVESTFP